MATEADRREAEDYGVSPIIIAVSREAKIFAQAAWREFSAYVAQPDHDVRSDEFQRLERAYLDARRLGDLADSAVTRGPIDLDEMVTELEAEHGHVRGIDLGSRFDDSSAGIEDDRVRYRSELAALIEATPGWEVHCYAMVSSGYPVRRFYLARRAIS